MIIYANKQCNKMISSLKSGDGSFNKQHSMQCHSASYTAIPCSSSCYNMSHSLPEGCAPQLI